MPYVNSDPSGLYRDIMWSSYSDEYLPPSLLKNCIVLFSFVEALPCMLTFMVQVVFRVFLKNAVHHSLIILPYIFLEIHVKILLMKWSRLLCVSDLSSFFTTPAVCVSFANLLQVIFTVYSRSLIFKIECKARFVESGDKFLLHQWHG